MKGFRGIGILIVFLLSLASHASAQSPTITTYVGSTLPVSGAPAVTQAIDYPAAVVSDGAGGFYVPSSAQNRIYRVAVDGTLSVIAGTGAKGSRGDGGPAISAELSYPVGMALDGAGNLFIA